MDPKLQLRVQRYGWDEAAPRYEAAWQAPLRPAHDTLLAMAELCPGHHVIETACGTGMATFRASDAVGEDGRVLATDLSQGMVNEITRRAIEAGRSNITAARMSAEELSVEPGGFDRALCALGLMYVPDPARALAELYRVLKAGGRATVTVWGERRNSAGTAVGPKSFRSSTRGSRRRSVRCSLAPAVRGSSRGLWRARASSRSRSAGSQRFCGSPRAKTSLMRWYVPVRLHSP